MKTISSATTTALAQPITAPGYLIRLDFPAITAMSLSASTQYYSTLSDISWDDTPGGGGTVHTWTGTDASVSGLSQDGGGSANAQLTLGNTDYAIGAAVLLRGAADIPVNLWAVYSTTPAQPDPVQVFSGVTDGADIALDKVTFTLVAQNNNTMQAPRVFIKKDSGFNFLQPEGTKVVWGNEIFELKRV